MGRHVELLIDALVLVQVVRIVDFHEDPPLAASLHGKSEMLKFRSILAAGLLALFALPALAASVVWQTQPVQIRTATGTVAAGAKALFYLAGTTTDFVVYTDNALTVPHAQPVVANSNGVFPTVYVPYVANGYRTRITTSANVVITDIDGIANPAPPSGGGGGGITVATEQVFQPGWTVFLLQTGPVTGFVRLNGRTIGNPTSGGSERANADALDVYTYYWTNCANAQCPVSTGRGGSAAADFAANKTLQLPDMRGRSPMGLDDMGNSAGNVAQVSPTISTTSGLPTITVSSAAGIVLGQTVVSANIPAGATVISIGGSSVILSANASATASGTASRFSLISDAQVASAVGGSTSRLLVTGEIPSHTHANTLSDTGHSHGMGTSAIFGAGATAAVVGSGATVNTNSATATPGLSINNVAAGGGVAHGILNPVIAGGWYAKI